MNLCSASGRIEGLARHKFAGKYGQDLPMELSLYRRITRLKLRKCDVNSHRIRTTASPWSVLWLMLPTIAIGQGVSECGSLDNMYGPFDYTNARHVKEQLPVVEGNHFTPEVESFQGHNKCGGNGCAVAGDIDYTLRAFPNHHRALLAMAKYHIQGLDRTMGRMRYTSGCYFNRAMRFNPSDGTVYMIYGYYLSRIGQTDTALEQYKKALTLLNNSAEAHYNIGLLYTDLRDYDNARKHAARAYELGFPLPGLRRKLERVGEWDELYSSEMSDNQ